MTQSQTCEGPSRRCQGRSPSFHTCVTGLPKSNCFMQIVSSHSSQKGAWYYASLRSVFLAVVSAPRLVYPKNEGELSILHLCLTLSGKSNISGSALCVSSISDYVQAVSFRVWHQIWNGKGNLPPALYWRDTKSQR